MGIKNNNNIKLMNRSSVGKNINIGTIIKTDAGNEAGNLNPRTFSADIIKEDVGSTKQINRLHQEYVQVNPIMLDAFNHMDTEYFKNMGHGLPVDLQGFNAADVGLALKKIEKQVKKNKMTTPNYSRMIYTFGKYMIIFYDYGAFPGTSGFSNLGKPVSPGIELRAKDTSLFATVRFDLENPRNPKVILSRNKSVFKNKIDGKLLQFLVWSLIQPDDSVLEEFLNKLATKVK